MKFPQDDREFQAVFYDAAPEFWREVQVSDVEHARQRLARVRERVEEQKHVCARWAMPLILLGTLVLFAGPLAFFTEFGSPHQHLLLLGGLFCGSALTVSGMYMQLGAWGVHAEPLLSVVSDLERCLCHLVDDEAACALAQRLLNLRDEAICAYRDAVVRSGRELLVADALCMQRLAEAGGRSAPGGASPRLKDHLAQDLRSIERQVATGHID